MIDRKILLDLEEYEHIKRKTARRKDPANTEHLEKAHHFAQQAKDARQKTDALLYQQNQLSEQIAYKKRHNQDSQELETQATLVSREVDTHKAQQNALEETLQYHLDRVPNPLDDSVPDGEGEEDNVVVRVMGKPRAFEFTPLAHDEVAKRLGGFDPERAAKLAASRFMLIEGEVAQLQRAISAFFLDTHTRHGYTEVDPPYLVNHATAYANGNLPKFRHDLYLVEKQGLVLIPTAELPLTQRYRNETLETSQLPIYQTALTPCFREEAGAAGKDTKGIIRQHQFQKVEMVKHTLPETSFEELDTMVPDAERVLQGLGLPYRIILLCAPDTGFAAAKTYDIEVWFPSQDKYREISSCSNCTDFQARRGNMRFRRKPGSKPEYLHTLNGSGVAVGRALAAVLENHQQADGCLLIPAALQPYMGGKSVLRPISKNSEEK